jgi:hypothetical protein
MCLQIQPLSDVDGNRAQLFSFHRRKGLKAALAGREAKPLSAILRFLIRYIEDYRFTRTLTDIANKLLGKELQEGVTGETRD